jgi:hypothetical protein
VERVYRRFDATVRLCTLRRAAQILGGPAQLRKYLNVSAFCLAAWMSGADTAPTYVFLKAVDLVMDEATANMDDATAKKQQT